MAGRFTLGNFAKAIRNPRMFLGELNKQATELNSRFHEYAYETEGTQIMEEDWDSLVILDACRYDRFKKINWLSGESEWRLSRGSQSLEFLEENFAGRTFHDTVYVTANPYANDLDSDVFFAVENLIADHWDEASQTVYPDDVTDAAISAHERYPNKRLIVHYMQPHCPFIGELGQQISHRGFKTGGEIGDVEIEGYSVWDSIRYGLSELSREHIVEAYDENLALVLESVESLLDGLDGKSVVTADHGNFLGERMSPIPVRGWGHPKYVRADELVKVPWFVAEYDSRRETEAESPTEHEEIDESVVEERLAAFGYK